MASMGRPLLVILCLVACRYTQAEDICAELGLNHHRASRGEDGATIVFCRNSTDGTVRGVTHIGQNQVSLEVWKCIQDF